MLRPDFSTLIFRRISITGDMLGLCITVSGFRAVLPFSEAPNRERLLIAPVVEASHQILFDLHPRMGINLGVLFAWTAINTAIFPFACYLMRWKQQREHRLKEQKEQQWLTAMSRPRTNLGIPRKMG